MRIAVLIAFIVGTASSATASTPGHPLDCSDWVFFQPGFTCSMTGSMLPYKGSNLALDSTGRELKVEDSGAPSSLGFVALSSLDRNAPPPPDSIAQVFARQGVNGTIDNIQTSRDCNAAPWVDSTTCDASQNFLADALVFDPVAGALFVPLVSYCWSPTGGIGASPCPYSIHFWTMRVDGFATLFEIFDSYTPPSGPLSFRVPAIPEGLPAVDSFDTYYGDLATVGDWGKAQSLQCDYPAVPPSAGDYFEIPDPLPNPAPGRGRYYVTAVNYQGQRRFGRRGSAGVLSGRDPTTLPACVTR